MEMGDRNDAHNSCEQSGYSFSKRWYLGNRQLNSHSIFAFSAFRQ